MYYNIQMLKFCLHFCILKHGSKDSYNSADNFPNEAALKRVLPDLLTLFHSLEQVCFKLRQNTALVHPHAIFKVMHQTAVIHIDSAYHTKIIIHKIAFGVDKAGSKKENTA